MKKEVKEKPVGTRRARRLALDDLNKQPQDYGLPRAVKRRRGSALSAYVGKNGSGKSLAMVRDILPDLKAGVPVLANLALLAPERALTDSDAFDAWNSIDSLAMRPSDPLRLPHPCWIPLKSFQQIAEFSNGIILLDEAQGIVDSRDSLGLPAPIRKLLHELRRNQIRLYYTAIDYSVVDKRLRVATRLLTYCKGTMPLRARGEMWARNRLFYYRSFDPDDFLDFNEAWSRLNDKNRPPVQFRAWARISGDLKEAADTYASGSPVIGIGTSGEGGRCLECGKKRKTVMCSCPGEHGD